MTAGADGVPQLSIDPTIPKSWPGFSATIRRDGGVWHVRVENPRGTNHGVARVTLDGKPLKGRIPLDAAGEHDVVVTMLGG